MPLIDLALKKSWMTHGVFSNSHPVNLTESINCPGCGHRFGAKKSGGNLRPEFDYIVHCIEECDDYRRLDIAGDCEECGLKFLTKAGLGIHKSTGGHVFRKYHRDWIPMYCVAIDPKATNYKEEVCCQGCEELFPAKALKNKVLPRIDFYVHCLEECEQYKELGLSYDCPHCEKKFLDYSMRKKHGCPSTPSSKKANLSIEESDSKSSSKRNQISPTSSERSKRIKTMTPKMIEFTSKNKLELDDEESTNDNESVSDTADKFDPSKFMIEFFEHDNNLPNVNYDLELPDDDDFGHFSYKTDL